MHFLMDKDRLTGELKSLVEECLKMQDLILVELALRYEGASRVLSILVDKPAGGITMGECAMLNRNLSRAIDEMGIIKDNYILEVSSPGLDRPLKSREDFLRLLGKEAVFFLNTQVAGRIEWRGFINKVDEENVYVGVKEDIISLPFLQINKAKLVIL